MKSSVIIPDSRVDHLTDKEENEKGSYVLYLMQSAQRAEQNHALEWAVRRANELEKSLVVCFGLDDGFPEANKRHFAFMLQGLEKTAAAIRDRNIGFVLRKGAPEKVALDLAQDSSHLVLDKGYLRYNRSLYKTLRSESPVPVTQIETEPPVPHSEVTDKQEYAARTIRPKVMKKLDDHLLWLTPSTLEKKATSLDLKGEEFGGLLDKLKAEEVGTVESYFSGGTAQAKSRFKKFLEEQLSDYDDNRNQPQSPRVSHMSPYLHYGQISPAQLLLMLREHIGRSSKNSDSYVEELAVRRTLSQNFCLYEKEYDSFSCLPEWAQESLEKHKSDDRDHIYTREELENAETHDPYWNAAQQEMVKTGYMHNHMRMYWGKQILAWTNTPKYAYSTALYLNNKYFLDGRDPNSFANIAWLFGLHDQGWKERAVYGKVRCMTSGGLERKCQPEEYVKWVESL